MPPADAVRRCSNCGQSGHNITTCPTVAAQAANITTNNPATPATGATSLQFDPAAIDETLRPTLAGACDTLAGVSMSAGVALGNLEPHELVGLYNDQTIDFAQFKGAMLKIMAVPACTPADMTRLAALLAGAGTGVVVKTMAPVAAGMPRVGVRERMWDSLLRKARADAAHLGIGAFSTPGPSIMKMTPGGDQYVEFTESDSDITDYKKFMLVLENFRHTMIGTGFATEMALHFFIKWHIERLNVGDHLVVVQRTMRMLIRTVDTGTRDWVSVIPTADGVLAMIDKGHKQAADEARERALIARVETAISGLTSKLPAAQASQATRTTAVQNPPGSAASRPCNMFNVPSPTDPSKSCACKYLDQKTGKCKYAHKCNVQLPNGDTCGKDHTAFNHK